MVDDYDNEESVAIIPEYGSGPDFKSQSNIIYIIKDSHGGLYEDN